MKESDRQRLLTFLRDHLSKLTWTGGSTASLQFSEFDLTPFDYLRYAELEIKRDDEASRINCVAHLKRAIDCELDTLLHTMRLSDLFERKNLKIGKKLEFIAASGLFRSKSIETLNTLRNRMEHDYVVPDAEDIELYFEIVQAMIYAIEGFIYMMADSYLLEFGTMQFLNDHDDAGKQTKERLILTAVYEFEKEPPTITFCLHFGDTKDEIQFDTSSMEDFAFGVKVISLLARMRTLVSSDFVLSELETDQQYGGSSSS